MITVHKFTVDPMDSNPVKVAMPRHAKLLTAREQRDMPCVWAQVNTDNTMVQRVFWLVGTGHPMDHLPITLKYVGSVQLMGGSIVLHVYDLGEES